MSIVLSKLMEEFELVLDDSSGTKVAKWLEVRAKVDVLRKHTNECVDRHAKFTTPASFTHLHSNLPQSYTGNFATDLCKGVFLTPLPLVVSKRKMDQATIQNQQHNNAGKAYLQDGEDLRSVSFKELQSHSSQASIEIWVAIHGVVYDLSHFLDKHPGGSRILLKQAGMDATQIFDRYHGSMGEASSFISKYSPPVKRVGIFTSRTT